MATKPKRISKKVLKAAQTRLNKIFGPVREENFAGRLELVHTIIITCALALERDNAEHGPELAKVLKVFAANELWAVILKMTGEEEE
jgi:hypothetical protein